MAIKWTQFTSGSKLKSHYLGPHKIVQKKKNDRYDVEKVGTHEGPIFTSTKADNIKLYDPAENESSDDEDKLEWTLSFVSGQI